MKGIRAFKKAIELSFEWRLAGYEVTDREGVTVAPVMDLLCDAESHKPRYIMAEIGGMIGITGKIVLLPVSMITRAGSGQVISSATMEYIQQSDAPEDPENPTREEEEMIFIHYGLKPYWEIEGTDEPEKAGKAKEDGEEEDEEEDEKEKEKNAVDTGE